MQAPPPKPKVRTSQGTQTGVYKIDTIKDIADSLNIVISDSVASALASDVEYRINQVIEEAARFMRHGRRTLLTTADIDLALRTLNIEPLYGHTPSTSSSSSSGFRRALPFPQIPAAGPVYFPEDEEIDFDRVLREEKIALPRGVSWTAHWLAVEGVQPLVPENPPAVPRESDGDPLAKGDLLKPNGVGAAAQPPVGGAGVAAGAPMLAVNGDAKKAGAAQQQQQLVKQVLSRELQLYYARLTASLLPPSASDHAKRVAALASLRHDAGLQALLPYLVRWVGEGVVGVLKEDAPAEGEGKVLDVLLDVIGAILDNSTLFVEPYLHQILPPILSILLHSSLPQTHTTHLRTSASQTLAKLLTQHSTTYPSLSPRIMKTLLLALISPGKSTGTREGAIRGLVGVGKEAVRKGLVEGGGARVVGAEWEKERERGRPAQGLVNSVMDALRVLQPPPSDDMSDALDPTRDSELIAKLHDVLGPFFARQVMSDAAWAKEILGVSS
ncbi:Transcription initiation factor TFIID subunit 6 [Psilocybe cubensis]|uniref:TATA box binding protein associated factor (TAF) histone-like fold domain-containing protein n=2 Tax=Psilocybe cubensis TaxID=181762 RepID=A0A8H7XPQ3_PSICU|nr:Transcription initiation factor TFIID subunit 6 [Psilocybe cubensis]KAH9480749.1 Transcription initiation factor TFIID subunit 6 [Psilocybe cubensis]